MQLTARSLAQSLKSEGKGRSPSTLLREHLIPGEVTVMKIEQMAHIVTGRAELVRLLPPPWDTTRHDTHTAHDTTRHTHTWVAVIGWLTSIPPCVTVKGTIYVTNMHIIYNPQFVYNDSAPPTEGAHLHALWME
jgi:hypothetical protein